MIPPLLRQQQQLLQAAVAHETSRYIYSQILAASQHAGMNALTIRQQPSFTRSQYQHPRDTGMAFRNMEVETELMRRAVRFCSPAIGLNFFDYSTGQRSRSTPSLLTSTVPLNPYIRSLGYTVDTDPLSRLDPQLVHSPPPTTPQWIMSTVRLGSSMADGQSYRIRTLREGGAIGLTDTAYFNLCMAMEGHQVVSRGTAACICTIITTGTKKTRKVKGR
ncbi:hypothetical protein F5H01DRAFT_402999 [Linnemannia elongata]|nr:hypothetical protein F5H01DRAFT_402999 [Linnemannia elongata]